MDYSQFLLMKEELSLIAVIVILFIADLFMSPDAHKNDGKPMLNTMLPVALLIIHTLITIVPGPAADAFGGMYHNQPIQSIVKSILSVGTLIHRRSYVRFLHSSLIHRQSSKASSTY